MLGVVLGLENVTGIEASITSGETGRAKSSCKRLAFGRQCKLFLGLHLPSIVPKSSIKPCLEVQVGSSCAVGNWRQLRLVSITPVKERAVPLSPEVTGKEPPGPAEGWRVGSRKKISQAAQ